jgi:GT2 family glycosyltransferase
MKDISVLIVSYNVSNYLRACLESLRKWPAASMEIIVVDNASRDESVEMVSNEFPEVRLICNESNMGFPAANNQAIAASSGRYLFLMNPDAELLEDTLNPVIHYMDAHSDVMMLAPRLLNTDMSLQSSVWRFPTLGTFIAETFYLRTFLKHKNYSDQDINQTFEAESFSGAAIFFRREVVEKIGTLDEQLFWIEDVDFCYRASLAGMKRIYFPEVKMLHHISKSAKSNYRISLSNQIFNKIKFWKKHYSRAGLFLVIAISLYSVIARIVIFGLLSPLKKMYRLKADAYLYTLPKVFNPPSGIC